MVDNNVLYDKPYSDNLPPPPNSPFFNDEDEDFTADNYNFPDNSLPNIPPPPPNSPFLNDEYDDDENFIHDNEQTLSSSSTSSKIDLGTMEEQKLSAMYRRAGAQTAADQQAIQTQWEEFQQIEKIKREQSGLSGDGKEKQGEEIISACIRNQDGLRRQDKSVASLCIVRK